MSAHEFEVTVSPDGSVRIEVRGTKGPVCEKYIEQFNEMLGLKEAEVERTSDYYAPPDDVGVDLNQGS